MEAIELTLRPKNGTPAANGASANGVSPSSAVPTGSASLRPPTLHEAVAALPLDGSGDLTRETMQPLAEAGDAPSALLCAAEGLTATRALVEVLRAAAIDTEVPVDDTPVGIDALADVIRDQLRRIERIIRGAHAELDQ